MGEVQSGKSLAMAYVLWLVGGFFGAHHMYLGNDTRAFWVVCTVGALGLGWLRDAWCLPSYVRSVNDPQLNEAALTPRRRSFFLMLALFVGSFVVTRLVGLALAPQSLTPWWWLAVVHAAAAALAARWVLGSSYHCATSASLLGTLAAAAAGQVVVLALPNLDRFPVASFIPSPAGASALGASVWVYRHRVWVPWASAPSRTASSRSLCARVVWLGFAVTAAVALLLASFVFNATLVVNGKQLSVAECLTRLDEVGLDEWSAAVTRWLESLDEWERITGEILPHSGCCFFTHAAQFAALRESKRTRRWASRKARL